jgi:hypothetical protein
MRRAAVGVGIGNSIRLGARVNSIQSLASAFLSVPYYRINFGYDFVENQVEARPRIARHLSHRPVISRKYQAELGDIGLRSPKNGVAKQC